MEVFLKLLGAAMLPVILSIGFYILKRKTAFHSWNYWVKQSVIGVAFGLAAIWATLHGVPLDGATANCRDAAPLCAGFLFGGPAGIIAGIIGGVHRWIAAPQVGEYSKIACSVATVVSGIYAALLRKYMSDGRRVGALVGALAAVVMEVFHLTLLLVTHMDGAVQALEIIKVCTVPMVFCNGIAVFIAATVIEFISYNVFHRHKKQLPRLNDKIQIWMLGAVLVGFMLSSFFIFRLQTMLVEYQTEQLLETSITDLYNEINDTADKCLAQLTDRVVEAYDNVGDDKIISLARAYQIAEIDVVDENGVITNSTDSERIGTDYAEIEKQLKQEKESEEQMFQETGAISTDLGNKYVITELEDGGFIRVGYTRERFKELMLSEIHDITRNRHIGNTGGLTIIDELGNVISATDGMEMDNVMGTEFEIKEDLEPGKVYLYSFYGTDFYIRFESAEGYYLTAYYPAEEALQSRDMEVYANTFMEILVFALMFGWIFYIVKVLVDKDLIRINDTLKIITSGKLDERVDVRTCVEFDELSNEINKTVDRLEEYTQEAEERMAKDLDLAKNIQQSALPSDFDNYRRIKEVDLYAGMEAAKMVGGDFYEFFMPDKTKLVFGVADVSGKGVPGAMFMMTSKTLLKSHLEVGMDIDEAFTEVNDKLCANNSAEMFVTAWMGILDIFTGHCEFANAGHNPPLVYRKGEGYSYLKCKAGFVLAGMEGVPYKKQVLDLNPGDKIFLYTDGVTEAQNQAQELYGEDRLLNCLNAHQDLNPDDTYAAVKDSLKEFVGEAEQFDDITILVVEFFGKRDV